MKNHYKDITEKLGEPIWWDESGVPRYAEFAPDRSADIYAREVALAAIKCQDCGTEFKVAFSHSMFGPSLADQIKDHRLHYGDPPNYGCCPAGPTMNSEFDRVVEYWHLENFKWVRHPELEAVAA